MTTSIGIDIGGTKIEIIALKDETGKELFKKRINTPHNYDDFVQGILSLIADTKNAIGDINHIGIGVPGLAYPDKSINIFTTFDFVHPDLVKDLEKSLNMSIEIANDANCLALSESYDGAGKGYDNVFAFVIGSGVGAGLVINQKIINGNHSITGELGNLSIPYATLEESNRTSVTRKKGCIEANISGPELIAEYNSLTGKNLSSTKEIWDLAENGEPIAVKITRQFYDRVARMLLIPLIMIDPDIYILAGGLSNIKDIYTKVPPLVTTYAKDIFGKDVTINLQKAKFGDSSGVRGAAWLWKNKT